MAGALPQQPRRHPQVQHSTIVQYSTATILRRHNLDNVSLDAVLGGEAALWTEQTSDGNVLTKVKLAVVDYIQYQ